jgi:hypothetical protein
VPEGLGVKIATKERSDDCNFHAKGNVRLIQLLASYFFGRGGGVITVSPPVTFGCCTGIGRVIG